MTRNMNNTKVAIINDPKIYIVVIGAQEDQPADGIPFVDEASLLAWLAGQLKLASNGDVVDVGFKSEFTIVERNLNAFLVSTPPVKLYPKPAEVIKITSHSRLGLEHEVWATAEKRLYFCSCEDFKFHPGKGCRHMLEALVTKSGQGYALDGALVIRVPQQ